MTPCAPHVAYMMEQWREQFPYHTPAEIVAMGVMTIQQWAEFVAGWREKYPRIATKTLRRGEKLSVYTQLVPYVIWANGGRRVRETTITAVLPTIQGTRLMQIVQQLEAEGILYRCDVDGFKAYSLTARGYVRMGAL